MTGTNPEWSFSTLGNHYTIQYNHDYKYTSDYAKRNKLDIERFLSHCLVLKLDRPCEVHEVKDSSSTA